MKHLAAKLAFAHRTLWHREPAYRWGALLGPPPLLGCAIAASALALAHLLARHAPPVAAKSDVPWAHWTRFVAQDGQPFSEGPSAVLPAGDGRGGYPGFQPGWVGTIDPLTVDATLDVNVVASVQGRFTLEQPTVPLERIVDAAPPSGLFVGLGRSFFVVRTAGLYAFSPRLARAGTQSADCLVRLASGHHQMVRNVVLNSAATAVVTFAPTEFRLEPGLFLLQFAVGCWRGDRMVGAGDMALMVRHPGETMSKPAQADELIRPVPKAADGAH